MNGSNLARLIVSAVVIAWAAFAIFPFKDTPFDEYLVERVTERTRAEGSPVLSREENVAAFRALMARAEERVAATVADPDAQNSTLFLELLTIAEEDGIDLADYFGDLRITDIANLERRNNLVLTRLLRDSKAKLQPGLDLAGGVSVTLEIPEDRLQETGPARQAELEQVREVILGRVDAYGVAEPVVRVRGNSQIEVQLAGMDTEQNTEIIEELIRPAKLEFSVVHRTMQPVPGQRPPLGYTVRYAEREDPETGRILEIPLYVRTIPVMDGDSIASARARMNEVGSYIIHMDFTDEGGRTFEQVTAQIARENAETGTIGRLAIILDGKVESDPTVRERIGGGRAQISGQFTPREAQSVATALNNPLSVELEIAGMNNVSGTLAAEAKSTSVTAAVIGAGLVVLFILAWYGVAGISAVLTVALNVFIVIGCLAAFGATITLPGIAALVLTVGMAVDANILIFERIREEQRAGKSIEHALTDGYGKALSTILDANVTTLITAIILIFIGTGAVRGFGITLTIGICTTVFTALLTSRFFMESLLRLKLFTGLPARASFIDRAPIQFLNFARPAFFSSWALIVIGIGAFALHFDKAFGIDFTGGDELQVSFEQPISDAQILEALDQAEIGEANVLRVNPLGASEELITIQVGIDAGDRALETLRTAFPAAGMEMVGLSAVGPSVGAEVTSSAITSMALALFAMLGYVALRFEFGFGLGALVSSAHDVLVTIALYFALGEFLNIGSGQFTAPMIAAVLMTVGYSINDTIVIFDRIREELQLNPGTNLKRVVHIAINQTLTRTILTSATTMFAALALALFGAGVIPDFALVFLIGVLTGTFSSLFIASPVFYWYHKGDRKSVERGEIMPSYDWSRAETDKPADPQKA